MHIRKLVKSGYASLVLAVPKEWVTANKLKAGDMVYLDQDSNKLIICPELKPAMASDKDEIVINVDNKKYWSVVRELIAAYMDNYNHIILKGKDLPAIAKDLKKTISDLVALELVDESSEKIVAKSFLNLYDVDIKLLINRIDNILRSVMIETKASLKNKDLVQSIVERDDQVNRLVFLLFKILKAGHKDKKILSVLKLSEMDVLRYWEVGIHMEKIGDRLKQITKLAVHLEPKKKAKFLALYEDIEKLYKDCMKAFYNFSHEMADTVSHASRNTMPAIIDVYIKDENCALCSQIAVNFYNINSNINDISRIMRYLR